MIVGSDLPLAMNSRQFQFARLSAFALAIFAGLYLVAFFPFAYFRHDDWLILGNAVRRVPENWRFLFDPTLYYIESREPWFFRPLFKLFAFLFHEVFGYRYWIWLCAMLLCTMTSLTMGHAALKRWCADRAPGAALVIFFVASLHVHVGSQVWLGEGLMNCPQLLCLSLATYCFARAVRGENAKPLWLSLSVVCVILGLGFKESSVFHAGFLAVAPWVEPSLRSRGFRERVALSLPFVILGAMYLPWRLAAVPLNPYYFQHVAVWPVLRGLGLMIGSFFLPFGAIAWVASRSPGGLGRFLSAVGRDWPYWGVFFVSLVPYLGHVFFSAGWLLIPAYQGLFLLALAGYRAGIDWEPRRLFAAAALVLVLSLIPVTVRMTQLRWWRWHEGQREMEKIIDRADPRAVGELVVMDCAKESGSPQLGMDRVVGFEASLYEMWALRHGTPVPVRILPCGARMPASRRRALVLRWEFPKLIEVTRPVAASR